METDHPGDISMVAVRRAFYMMAPGGWRDYANLIHAPYTVWHLSYVVIGAALTTRPSYTLLAWTMLAFFLAMGLGAHALDELHGRPLRTNISAHVLWGLGLGTTAAASAIGLVVGVAATPWVLPFIAVGAFLVLAYNLEWGPFHRDLVFAFAWGAFPVLTSFVVQSGGWTLGSVLVAVAAAGVSYAQRILSTRVRHLRRHVVGVDGYLLQADGSRITLSREWLIAEYERALFVLAAAMPATALGLLFR